LTFAARNLLRRGGAAFHPRGDDRQQCRQFFTRGCVEQVVAVFAEGAQMGEANGFVVGIARCGDETLRGFGGESGRNEREQVQESRQSRSTERGYDGPDDLTHHKSKPELDAAAVDRAGERVVLGTVWCGGEPRGDFVGEVATLDVER